MMENNRNYFIAIALSVADRPCLAVPLHEPEDGSATARWRPQQALQGESAQPVTPETPRGDCHRPPSRAPNQAEATQNREQAVAASPRVAIDTPALAGSINLVGARFDDLRLREYHETVDDESPIITLFSARPTPVHGYFTELGYVGRARRHRSCPRPRHAMDACQRRDSLGRQPGHAAELHQRQGRSLQPHYLRRRALPDHRHRPDPESDRRGGGSCPSYGRVTRYNKPATPSVYVIHEGFIGVLGENGLIEESYGDVEEEAITNAKATGGWLGITDKYWAATLVPPQALPYRVALLAFHRRTPRFQADFRRIRSRWSLASQQK
jgi:YidC/Oxa1 family membrane protein insertase